MEKEPNQSTSIALMSLDIGYIKKDLEHMNDKLSATDTKLDAVLSRFIRREEFEAKIGEHQHQLDKRVDGIHVRIGELQKEKLSKEEFEPTRITLNRVNWLILSAVVVALLSIIMR